MRQVEFTLPVTTTQFSPLQLRPRTLLGLMSESFARWLAAHLVPFPALITEHGTAVVVQSVGIDYVAPDLRFDESEWITVRCTMSADLTGDRLWLWVDYLATDRLAARGTLIVRVVRLGEKDSLAARPGSLPDHLLAMFAPGEIRELDARQPARDAKSWPAGDHPVLTSSWNTVLCRSQCEVADQWSFIEMVELVTHARERMCTVDGSDVARHAVAAPLRSLRASFRRPMFLFDECQVDTTTRTPGNGDGPVFHHEVRCAGRDAVHLSVWEQLDPLDS
jgi:acyl-CoA thioesterase FadM